MAVTENNVLLRSKDGSGNSKLYYPITKVENVDGLEEALSAKVDKIAGKGLSTNDYTTAEKNKLSGIADGANKTTVDSALSSTSTNPVQNKVVNTAISSLQTAVNGKAASSHTHNYAGSSSVGGAANSAVKATQDSDGSQINTTYVKKSGSTMSNLNALLAGASTTKNYTPNVEAVASSPFARDLWHDHFAFLSGGHTIMDHQITTDGDTWEDSTLDLTPLFMQKEAANLKILDTTDLARRFTICSDTIAYSMVEWYEIGVGFTNPCSNFEVCIERSKDNNTWSEVHRSTVDGDSKPYFLRGVRLGDAHRYVRFTFTKTTNITTGTVRISCIKAYTSRKADQGRGIEYEYPYDWNSSRDIFPHADNRRTLGLSNRRWLNVYATTFTGSLSGNAGSATKLATARTFRTNLGSTSTASFNGTADVTPGVTGTLGLANGGTGATTAAAGRANLGAAKVYWFSEEPTEWTTNDMWLQII